MIGHVSKSQVSEIADCRSPKKNDGSSSKIGCRIKKWSSTQTQYITIIYYRPWSSTTYNLPWSLMNLKLFEPSYFFQMPTLFFLHICDYIRWHIPITGDYDQGHNFIFTYKYLAIIILLKNNLFTNNNTKNVKTGHSFVIKFFISGVKV